MNNTLSDDDLLNLLSTEGDQLAREAVDEILRRGERLAPALIRIAEDRARWERPEPESMAPVHATLLLACLQPPGALEPLLRAVRTSFDLQEIFVSDYADLLLARCGPAALDALAAVARTRTVPFEMRLSVLEAIARIGLAHPASRSTARDHLLAAARNEGEDPELRNLAAHAFAEFATPDDRRLLRELLDEDLLAQDAADLAASGRFPAHYAQPLDLLEFYDPESIEDRQKLWDETEATTPEAQLPDDPSLEALSRLDSPGEPPPPIVNAAAKVGRNDPCPCGSGSKYKKCCGG